MKTQLTPSIRVIAGIVSILSLLPWACASARAATTPAETTGLPFPVVTRFENFGEKDGLPSHKVHCVLKTKDGKLWLGTTNGLCVREPDGKFRRYGPEEGLSHPVGLSIAEDPGAGAGAYHIKTKSWTMYDQNNADMEEPWCYAIAPGDGVVYIGVWAGGIVEHDPRTGSFKAYRDPDGDFQFQLTPDSGPIADITSWVAYQDGILWQSTYFGLSRYDTKEATWRTWVQDKTPLASNFINTVFARGRVAWVATDRGVSVTDGNDWVNYLVDGNGRGVVRTYRPGQEPQTRTMTTALADGFVLGVWADDHEAWFATSNGLSHGIFDVPTASTAATATTSPTVASNL